MFYFQHGFSTLNGGLYNRIYILFNCSYMYRNIMNNFSYCSILCVCVFVLLVAFLLCSHSVKLGTLDLERANERGTYISVNVYVCLKLRVVGILGRLCLFLTIKQEKKVASIHRQNIIRSSSLNRIHIITFCSLRLRLRLGCCWCYYRFCFRF